MNENEVMKKEREAMKKSHLEALISEWKFQCAEGIYTYPRERMFEICYTDAYEQGRKEATAELEAQIEKLIDFVLSKTECCDVCPITDTCINSEGTCPYVGILAKGEEAVTREWLMQKIVKEIKEK